MSAPIIGITTDMHENRYRVSVAYSASVVRAGGIPVLIPPVIGQETNYLSICDGFVFTGGDDPRMEQWDVSTHENATPVTKVRQDCELTLLGLLQKKPEVPVLGVCLGMQWMGLLAGGTLDQDLVEPLASNHVKGAHVVSGVLGTGEVHTHHHQALTDVGSLSVIAEADDGVLEGIRDYSRNWYVGVQWHPERTAQESLGQGLFDQLICAVRNTIGT